MSLSLIGARRNAGDAGDYCISPALSSRGWVFSSVKELSRQTLWRRPAARTSELSWQPAIVPLGSRREPPGVCVTSFLDDSGIKKIL
jgi:hypothetical protein